jgi:pimeloyl-[acyl-carrier protein] methyl ester esterase
MVEVLVAGKIPLVLLHGWGVNQGVWQQLVPQLAVDFEVLAPDLPGFGTASASYPQPYQLKALAQQLAAAIPPASLVVGWSLGGLVATQLALDYPEKVAALGWVASSPCFMAQADWPGMADAVLKQFAGALTRDLALTVERFLAIQAMGSETARQDIKMLKHAVLALPMPQVEVLMAGLDILAATDLRPQLAQLQQPVAACFGKLDALVPVAMVEPLLQWLPTLQVHIIPKASHAPFISHPTDFIEWIQQFGRQHSALAAQL